MCVTGTDTSAVWRGSTALLAGVRRLTRARRRAPPTPRRSSARSPRELLSDPGRARRCTSTISRRPAASEDLVAVYMFEGNGRLSYLQPRAERPPGVSWVASTGRSFLAADADELDGQRSPPGRHRRDQLRAAAAAVRARRGRGGGGARAPPRSSVFSPDAVELAGDARRPGRHRARARARARRGGHRPGDRLHEPSRDAPAPGRGDRPRHAHRRPAVVPADRPRRLQARQRPPRPPGRRRAAARASSRRSWASSARSTASPATAATSSS